MVSLEAAHKVAPSGLRLYNTARMWSRYAGCWFGCAGCVGNGTVPA
jgi:hypothetical protein